MKAATRILITLFALSLAAVALTGCGEDEKPPVLTPEQLQAGIVGEEHPVSQEAAQQQGCACHLQ